MLQREEKIKWMSGILPKFDFTSDSFVPYNYSVHRFENFQSFEKFLLTQTDDESIFAVSIDNETGLYQFTLNGGGYPKKSEFMPCFNPVVVVVVKGYRPYPFIEVWTDGKTTTSYIGEGSVDSIIDPARAGDPCVSLLRMPKGCKESHHYHSTPRIIHVLEGSAKAIFGVGEHIQYLNMTEGGTLILDEFVPHHFETSTGVLFSVLRIWSDAIPDKK